MKPKNQKARLDANKDSKPLTSISSVVTAGKKNTPDNVQEYVYQENERDCLDCGKSFLSNDGEKFCALCKVYDAAWMNDPKLPANQTLVPDVALEESATQWRKPMNSGKFIADCRECIQQAPGIRISYPPDYDGELHIHVAEPVNLRGQKSYVFVFEHAAKKEDEPWDVLVEAAKAILEQDKRRRG
jgi:hypothetical protein